MTCLDSPKDLALAGPTANDAPGRPGNTVKGGRSMSLETVDPWACECD